MLTQALADRCCGDWSQRFSASERTALSGIVRVALMDTAACVLAGRDEPVTRVIGAWARRQSGGDRSSSIVFSDERLDCATAALINCVAGHALDYDDVGLAGHPSVVIAPALLAECERSGQRDFAIVQAYAKAYAVWGELNRRLKISLHARGWHPSSVFGVIAAAMAIASLRDLDEVQTANALGIAASLAGGVVANFGSMTKPLHIGRAAQAGIQAAELAEAGLDASLDAIDGKAGLLLALTGAASSVDLDSAVPDEFERILLLQRPGIKKYPVCYASHRVVDGVLQLLSRHRFAPANVARVDASISETAANVLRHHDPNTLTEARFSLEFSVAAAVACGRLGLAEVSEETLRDAEVRELMRRVNIGTVQTKCPDEPSFAYTDQVTVTLSDGSVLDSGPIRFAVGHRELPMDDAQVLDKLRSCVRPGEESVAQRVIGQIDAWVPT